jgi:2-(1,2-epoxy-1,2-dihydrophenyl)acetyl-CoA isomerase
MSGDADTVLCERLDAITVVTLNRPERRNGVTVPMARALYQVVQSIAASDTRVLVLRGAGKDFCVGADLGGGDTTPRQAHGLADLGLIHHASTLLHSMPQITIAAIDGGCAGAGMGWASSCDFRFAADTARFNTAFLDVGVSGDIGLAWNLHRLVGPARARELLCFPMKFDAARALEIGLVTRTFSPAVLHEETLALARQLAARDAFALRMMKANLLSAEHLTLEQFIDVETVRHLQTTQRVDFRTPRHPTPSSSK